MVAEKAVRRRWEEGKEETKANKKSEPKERETGKDRAVNVQEERRWQRTRGGKRKRKIELQRLTESVNIQKAIMKRQR